MHLDKKSHFIVVALTVGGVLFACSSKESPSSSTSGSGGGSSVTTQASSTSTSASSVGGASSDSTMAAVTSMGGATAAVSSDAVTIDSTSSTISTSTDTSSSTGDSTTDSTASTSAGGSSTSDGMGGATSMGAGGTMSSGEFTFTTPSFDAMEACACEAKESCDTFPQENTNFGNNTSPEFNWSGAPDGTQSYAIVLQDIANGYVHWAIWNIPGSATSLPSGLPSTPTLSDPDGAQQATFFNMMGYFGPGACNVYEFTLYALDTASFTPSDTGDPEVVKPELDAAGALATLSIRAAAADDYCSGGGTCDL